MSSDSIPDSAPFAQDPNRSQEFVFDSSIRFVILDGEPYWSIFDTYRVYGKSSNPRCDWTRSQKRFRWQRIEVGLHQRKYQFTDKRGRKSRSTPVGSKTLIDVIISDINLKCARLSEDEHEIASTNSASIDELLVFHPAVMSFFASCGCVTEHHVALPSRKRIDIVVISPDGHKAIVECKNHLIGASLFEAIGQVLCYCAEYAENATPIVACPSGKTNAYAYWVCSALGIEVLEI